MVIQHLEVGDENAKGSGHEIRTVLASKTVSVGAAHSGDN